MITELLDDDIRLSAPEPGMTEKNPFPGLRSFEFTEAHLFFGQDKLCDQVLEKLRKNRFVCILGGAGVGKTSLINCGIKPALFTGILNDFSKSWQIFHLQPGNNPTLNLARCISKSKKVELFDEDQHLREQICSNILKRGRQGLVELISQISGNNKDEEYLFIIDQFEDLFRLRGKNKNYSFYEEASQYVDLLMNALQSPHSNVQIIVSIRSDFTDDSILFPTLAELINKSNVVVPKMNRGQIKEILLGPLRVFKVQADDSLIARIINDSSATEDVLPRFQHTLHQTWKAWLSQSNWHKPLSLKEYESVGGLLNSLTSYADSIYESLEDSDKLLCEKIFKSLTERGSENKGFIKQVPVAELAYIGEVPVSDIRRVINFFRNKDINLITLIDNDCSPEGLVSLTHVSLIRIWDRLKAWVEDEAISGQMYKQLSDTSGAYLIGKASLLRPPDLNFALNWKEKQNPNVHWARRYNPAFERTMVYLNTSNESFQAEIELKRLQATKTQRKVRSLFSVLGFTLFIALGLTIYSQFSRSSAEKQKDLAIEQSRQAEEKSQKAEMISKEALEEKMRAENAANESERLRQQIEEESKVLAEQKQVAEYTAIQAVQKSTASEQNLQQLSQQNKEIEKNVQQANLQKSEAEKEAEAAYKKRMVSTAQTLAVKSLQIQNNKALKSLLSAYAFSFNEHNGGPEIQPEIFNSLISSSIDLGISYRYSLRGHDGAVNSMCVLNRTNTMYSTGGDGKVLSWNISETAPAPKLLINTVKRNLSIAVSPNGKWLAVGSDMGVIRIVDLTNLGSLIELKGHSGAVFALAFSRDALQLFSCSSDKKIFLWDIESRTSKEIYNAASVIRAMDVSPDGRFLAAGSDDGKLLLWDIKSNQMIPINSELQIPIYSLNFNSTGTLLATGDIKGNIKLWNPFSRKLMRSLKGHSARVVDLEFSMSGDFLISSSYDGSAYIFDAKQPSNPPQVIKETNSYVMAAVFSPNNQRVFIATNKVDNLISWPANNKVLSGLLCQKLTRNLSTDEWNTYMGNDIKFEKPCE